MRRCEILDFWRAMEDAWARARLQFGEDARCADHWTRRVAQDVKAGDVQPVIARLHTLRPTSPESRAVLGTLFRYFRANAARIQYHACLRLSDGIGSGAGESAHRQIVHARMRQAVMRCSVAGVPRVSPQRARGRRRIHLASSGPPP